uniref:SMC hinge domain-containing protein n=1 Tax=Steinernema glaseri TaxID=37863 RepID=A0A1I8AWF5_9BILA
MGFLHLLEIENFKSYSGKNTIGPFKRFTAIIGPNGSGKSNLMDAICFVLGEKASALRVRKLGDLIHGAPVNKPVANRCHVSMHYVNDDGSTTVFTRAVHSSSSEYRINNTVCSPQEYTAALEAIQIFIKAKNFLVYQGRVESVAMKNPKERTQMFEELSRSNELQNEYAKLKTELTKAENDAQLNMNKRRSIAAEKREAKIEQTEAEKYNKLREEMNSKNLMVHLLQLFHAEREKSKAIRLIEEKREELEEYDQKTKDSQNSLLDAQRDLKRVLREMHKCDKKLVEKEKQLHIQKPEQMKANEQVHHIEQKLNNAKKLQATAIKMAESHRKDLKNMEARIEQLKKEKADAIKKHKQISQQMQQLTEAQEKEYEALKKAAMKRCSSLDAKLDRARHQEDSTRSALDHLKRRKEAQKDKIKQKESEIERHEKHMNTLAESEKTQTELLEVERENLRKLEEEVRVSKDKQEKVDADLAAVTKQLSDAHGDTAENDRVKRKNEAIENLKRVFPDKVYGRLVDLCQPSQRRFQLAITKVLAKNMFSIVCDTETTARECITYLKERRYGPETFLPLSGLVVHPINENLRDIREPPGVKLVYDVIQCNLPAARKALQFACGNSLVCEKTEDARKLAFGANGDRYKAVALDGTLFQQSGVISGGGRDLKNRAKRWDEQAIRKLKERRAELAEQSQALHRSRKKELDVEMKRNQLQHLERRLKNTRTDRKNSELTVTIETELARCETALKERIAEVNEIQERRDSLTDEIFSEFCKKTNISDIRKFEEQQIKLVEEHQKVLKNFDTEIDRHSNELEYLSSENDFAREKVEADRVKALEHQLKSLKAKALAEDDKLKSFEEECEQIRKEMTKHREKVKEQEAVVSAAKKELQSTEQERTSIDRSIMQYEQVKVRKQQLRHSLLNACKMEGIEVPLLNGYSFSDFMIQDDTAVDPESLSQSQPAEASSQSSQLHSSQSATSRFARSVYDNEERIKIDYKDLPTKYQKLEDENEIKKLVEKWLKEVSDAQTSIAKLNAPNNKAAERMEQVKARENEMTAEGEQARKKAKKARQMFEKVRAERYKRF